MAEVTEVPVAAVVDEHHRYRPGEPLRRYVAWYTGYRQRGIAPARHRGLPSPYLTMIVTLDEPLSIEAHPDPGQPPGEFGTLLGGLHSSPALIRHDGAQSGIQLALKPPGVRALLGLPAGELADIDVPAEAVLGGVCAELRERVRGASGWPERFAIVDEILLRQLLTATNETVAPEVLWSWRQLLQAGGAVRVADLAAGTGWSGRHLASRFRAEIGLTPKAAARVVRFDRARRRLVEQASSAVPADGAGPAGYQLADLAAETGYFDQAHLAREFRALAGLPPSQWLAEEFRNVQAGTWADDGG